MVLSRPLCLRPPRWSAPTGRCSILGRGSSRIYLAGAAHCDANGGALLRCYRSAARPDALTLAVKDIGGEAYGVWRTDLAGAAADASDFQALRVVIGGKGEGLRPHLYLIDQDGVRSFVDLTRFGVLRAAEDDIIVPLVWFADGSGQKPDLTRLAEFQIVFEWQEMTGNMLVEEITFVQHVRRAPATVMTDENPQAPPGFAVSVFATGFPGATSIHFGPDGALWLSRQTGDIWRLTDTDGDFVADEASLFASGFIELLGLLWRPTDGTLYASSRATISALGDADGDGRADSRVDLVTDLPWGRHQNNQMAWGPDGLLYFGIGSLGDVDVDANELSGTVVRMPHLGTNADLEIVSRGNRNAYDVGFNADGALFASENGPDFNDAPDELNHILPGEHYGYPLAFGADDGGGEYRAAVWSFDAHASADGLVVYEADQFPAEYFGNVFVALFGQVFGEEIAGHEVSRLVLTPTGDTFSAQAEPFLTQIDRPLDVTVGPDGALWVLEYVRGTVYRVVFEE